MNDMRGLMCKELTATCTGQRSIGREVDDTTIGERLSVELSGLAISRWPLANLDR